MGNKMKAIVCFTPVALFVAFIGWGIVEGIKPVDAQASWFSSVDTFYDEPHSVFCATRLEAMSCVYVPRDTVRNEGSK